jgi:hypothetical protein
MELAFENIAAWDGTGPESLNGYLARIGLDPSEISCGPSFQQLERLVLSQLKSVPFETLDTHFGIRVRLLSILISVFELRPYFMQRLSADFVFLIQDFIEFGLTVRKDCLKATWRILF